jgi:four helix bundle protein
MATAMSTLSSLKHRKAPTRLNSSSASCPHCWPREPHDCTIHSSLCVNRSSTKATGLGWVRPERARIVPASGADDTPPNSLSSNQRATKAARALRWNGHDPTQSLAPSSSTPPPRCVQRLPRVARLCAQCSHQRSASKPRTRIAFAQRDQALRAAKSICLNTAEAAGRTSPADKARVFGIARGEVLEVAAALEIAALAGDCEPQALELASPIADRLYSLLTGLSR